MTQIEIADRLLWPIWTGINSRYKAKYARNIWQQLEDNIRSAAYTSSLPKFYETLCRRLDIAVRAKDQAALGEAIGCGEDRQILRCIRDETTYLVLLVRVRNDERRERMKAELQEADEDSLFRPAGDGALVDHA